MFIYYATSLFCLTLGYIYDRDKGNNQVIYIYIATFFFSIVYGFRYEVGVDWLNYIVFYENSIVNLYSFDTIEVGYKFLNVIAYYVDAGIVTVVMLSTILFFLFTFLAAKKSSINPFYFLAIVAPYHLVMSGVNYTRQSVALSIFIFSVSLLLKGDRLKFFFFILVAASFHTSSLVFLPLIFIGSKKRYLLLSFLVVAPPIIFYLFTAAKYQQYIESEMDSAGFYLRALYLIGPSALLLIHWKVRDNLSLIENRLFLLSIFSFPFLIILSILSTTVADRFCYYFILLATLIWMVVRSKGEEVKVNHLKFHGSTLLYLSSTIAFITWHLYSGYIQSYKFDSYIFYWLG